MQHLVDVLRFHAIRNLRFLVMLLTDRRELLLPRAVALLSVAAFVLYTRSPYQLIPEHVPVFGYVDDISILVFGLFMARRLTPSAYYNNVSEIARGREATATAIAVNMDYAPPVSGFRESGQPAPVGLYDLLGYRRAWRVRSVGRPELVSQSAPIVIGGCGRSGTTLLRTIFNRHPAVFCGDESTVFLNRISSPRDIARRYRWDSDLIAGMMRSTRCQAEFIERFEAECLARSGKSVWAEKTPDNVLRFDFVRQHFPRAHIVHVIRDGRDVVCSLRRQKWLKIAEDERGDIGTVEFGIEYWKRRVEAGLKFRGDPLYHEIRYEDLIDNPEQTLRSLFEALRIEWDGAVLVPSRRADPVPSHEGTINADALGQWRRELTAGEVALIDGKAGAFLRQLGYTA